MEYIKNRSIEIFECVTACWKKLTINFFVHIYFNRTYNYYYIYCNSSFFLTVHSLGIASATHIKLTTLDTPRNKNLKWRLEILDIHPSRYYSHYTLFNNSDRTILCLAIRYGISIIATYVGKMAFLGPLSSHVKVEILF